MYRMGREITVWTKITLREKLSEYMGSEIFQFLETQHFVKVNNSQSSILSFKKSKPWNT